MDVANVSSLRSPGKPHVLRAGIAVCGAFGLTAALAACGEQGLPEDVCELLTPDEIESVLGEPVEEGRSTDESDEAAETSDGDSGDCSWQNAEGHYGVTLLGFEGGELTGEERFEAFIEDAGRYEESGVADEAVWLQEDILIFRDAEVVYLLQMASTELEDAEALAGFIIDDS